MRREWEFIRAAMPNGLGPVVGLLGLITLIAGGSIIALGPALGLAVGLLAASLAINVGAFRLWNRAAKDRELLEFDRDTYKQRLAAATAPPPATLKDRLIEQLRRGQRLKTPSLLEEVLGEGPPEGESLQRLAADTKAVFEWRYETWLILDQEAPHLRDDLSSSTFVLPPPREGIEILRPQNYPSVSDLIKFRDELLTSLREIIKQL